MPGRHPTFDELAVHADGLRRLARVLVKDASSADDLVQDTLVAAVQSPTGPRGGLRAWLRGIARNLARKQYRDTDRRLRRERAAATPEGRPGTAEAAAGIEIQRRVIELLDELPERQRTALYLRYFEDLPPRRIAERIACPVATVHTYIRRGREQMRAALDRSALGGRARWLLALAPIARPPRVLAAIGGSIAMKKAVTACAAAGLLLLGAWLVWDLVLRPDEAPAGGSALLEAEAPAKPGLDPAALLPKPSSAPEAEADDPLPVRHLLTVRLQTPDGEVLPGTARVVTEPIRDMRPGERWDGSDFTVETTASSWPHEADISALFAEHQQPMVELEIELDHPAYLPVRHRFKLGMATPEHDANDLRYTATLLVRKAAVLEGRVLDTAGLAVPGAHVGAWPTGFKRHGRPVGQTTADEAGRYRLRVPGGFLYAVVAAKRGMRPGRVKASIARGGTASLEDIVLAPGCELAGRLLLNDMPVRGAAISVQRVQNGETAAGIYEGWYQPGLSFTFESWHGPMDRHYLAAVGVRDTADGVGSAKAATVTDADGRFVLPGLSPGRHRVRLEPWIRPGFIHRSLIEKKLIVDAPDADVAVKLVGSLVRFEVRAGDERLADAAVRVGIGGKVHGLTDEQLAELAKEVDDPEELASLGEHRTTVRTAEDGKTTPLLVPPDRELRISVHRDGYVARQLRLVSKPAGASWTHRIDLEPEEVTVDEETGEPAPTRGSLAVELKTPDNARVPRVTVGVFRDAKWPYPEWRRRAKSTDNTFRVDNIPPGTWRIVVRPGGTWAGAEAFWLDAETTVTIKAGEVARTTVASRRGGRLRLTVRDAAGRESNARARILDAEGNAVPVKFVWRVSGGTGLGGSGLAVPGPNEVARVLPPGRYTVEFSRNRLKPGEVAPVRREIVLRPGELIDLDVQLSSDG